MDTFARNALRLSLAGAGIAVLGAGFVGQASAEEAPVGGLNGGVPDTSSFEPTVTGALPSATDNDLSLAGESMQAPEFSTLPAYSAPTAATPSSDSLPSLTDTSAFQVPSVANLQAPGF